MDFLLEQNTCKHFIERKKVAMRTIGMSDYTVGEDCFIELPAALAEYGATKVGAAGYRGGA